MKKLIFLITALLFILSSCSNSHYKLIAEDGNYYIEVTKLNADYYAVMPVTFPSIDEMVRCIEEGDFSWKQLQEICKFRPQQNGHIQIINLSNLYEPIVPDLVGGYSVLWYGDEYRLSITASDDKELSFLFRFRDKEYFERIKKEHKLDAVINSNNPEPTVDGDERSVKYEYRIGDAKREITYYSIGNGSKELLIVLYFYSHQSSTPYTYNVYGTEQGQYFQATIDCNRWISMDKLKQFGVREYVETQSQ